VQNFHFSEFRHRDAAMVSPEPCQIGNLTAADTIGLPVKSIGLPDHCQRYQELTLAQIRQQ